MHRCVTFCISAEVTGLQVQGSDFPRLKTQVREGLQPVRQKRQEALTIKVAHEKMH